MYAPHGGNEVAAWSRSLLRTEDRPSLAAGLGDLRRAPTRCIAAVDSDRRCSCTPRAAWFLVRRRGRTVRTDLPGGAELFQ